MVEPSEARWLLLIHQIPPQPSYLRVKVRRRLQQLGAVSIKQTVYALPRSAQAQEDFEWLRGEIVAGGGEAFICSAGYLGGFSDAEVKELFVDAREQDYLAIAEDVFVDRMASAWLIRRFIDPGARFSFVPERRYRPGPGEVRFDMFEAEFTHEGDRCTFETLVHRFGIADRHHDGAATVVDDVTQPQAAQSERDKERSARLVARAAVRWVALSGKRQTTSQSSAMPRSPVSART